ncbi:hypothetical protein HPULCUR_009949 [Helicostylum pulchrum]|uniref:Tc1-like transposase DDE domain-containing protein n=1 Tax=Helicostylum pulchrum TaxID=562976 RepID=A0ABP9YBY3_9FUNG
MLMNKYRTKISLSPSTVAVNWTRFSLRLSTKKDFEFPEMKGYFIVMDNAPIHIPQVIDPVIISRGYTPVYLPLYSPELNPIEQFWAIVKGKIKCNKLTDLESLTTHIIEASEAVPVEYLRAFIQHSVNQFDNCLNKVAI